MFSHGILTLVWQSDAATKLVLLILTILSVACWTTAIFKFLTLRVIRAQLRRAQGEIVKASDMPGLLGLGSVLARTAGGFVLGRHLAVLKKQLELTGTQHLSEQQWGLVSYQFDGIVEDEYQRYMYYLPILSVGAAAAPLLGLLGTVWGLIHAFINISQHQSADIATVAPGIAEALITTLFGLIVAIPALALYHYLVGQVQSVVARAQGFSDDIMLVAHKLFVQDGKSNDAS
jgi:biopolymer transport protein TolQ